MLQKILITGASGFLGSRIKTYFSKKDFEILAPSHEQMNLLDENAISAYIKKEIPDYMIHCAAISDTGYCQQHEEESYSMNVKAVEAIAKACKYTNTKLIFCSSDQVYFGTNKNNRMHTEDEIITPLNVYGKHKLQAETLCSDLCPDSVILRLTWMYDTKKIQEKEHGNFYTNTKDLLARGETCLFPIHDYRGITYVWSIIDNLSKALYLPGGVYNFGAENQDTTYDTIKELFMQKDIDLDKLLPNTEAFKDNPRNISMSIDKIRTYGIDFKDTLTELKELW